MPIQQMQQVHQYQQQPSQQSQQPTLQSMEQHSPTTNNNNSNNTTTTSQKNDVSLLFIKINIQFQSIFASKKCKQNKQFTLIVYSQ